jgi:hypothetical protein
MIKTKTASFAAFLMLSISLTMLTVFANAEPTAPNMSTWVPPSLNPNWVDPVTLKIREFKTQGFSDYQITSELTKLGMGWNQKTGATAIGIAPSSEEVATMPPMKNPFTMENNVSPLTGTQQKNAVIWVDYANWAGVGNNMVPGSGAIGSGQTWCRYITTHVGTASMSSWTEIGIKCQIGDPYNHWIYSYDNDEPINGDNFYYIQAKTNWGSSDAYSIVLRGTYDANGWWYDTYLNYQWVRSGHLPSYSNSVNEANEAFSDTGSWTTDTSDTMFNNNFLLNPQNSVWQPWAILPGSPWYAPTHMWADYPQTYSINTWVEDTSGIIFLCGTHP